MVLAAREAGEAERERRALRGRGETKGTETKGTETLGDAGEAADADDERHAEMGGSALLRTAGFGSASPSPVGCC